MVAGFNLEDAVLENLSANDTIFIYVNLKNATLRNCKFNFAIFDRCDLSRIEAIKTELIRCSFYKSLLNHANLLDAHLTEVGFKMCEVDQMLYKSSYGTSGINYNYIFSVSKNFPAQLSLFGVRKNKATAGRIENALKEMREHPFHKYEFIATAQQFLNWSRCKNRHFKQRTIQQVEDMIEKHITPPTVHQK